MKCEHGTFKEGTWCNLVHKDGGLEYTWRWPVMKQEASEPPRLPKELLDYFNKILREDK